MTPLPGLEKVVARLWLSDLITRSRAFKKALPGKSRKHQFSCSLAKGHWASRTRYCVSPRKIPLPPQACNRNDSKSAALHVAPPLLVTCTLKPGLQAVTLHIHCQSALGSFALSGPARRMTFFAADPCGNVNTQDSTLLDSGRWTLQSEIEHWLGAASLSAPQRVPRIPLSPCLQISRLKGHSISTSTWTVPALWTCYLEGLGVWRRRPTPTYKFAVHFFRGSSVIVRLQRPARVRVGALAPALDIADVLTLNSGLT